jgi:hypothetical protein
MGKYLDDANTLYREALNELARFRQSQDQTVLRDAAEKGWGAVTQASNELLAFYDRAVVPSGTGARRGQLTNLERQQRPLRRLYLAERFSAFENELHKECFYDGTCPLPITEATVRERVKEFLDDIARVTQGQSGRGR